MQPGRRGPLGVFLRLLELAAIGAAASTISAQDIGFEGPSFAGAGPTPTESKPENKLWYHDGRWWGSLWSSTANAFRIHRLDFTTHAWVDTGVAIEARPDSHSDVLWDGTKLYIASHEFFVNGGAPGNPILLFRCSYASATKTYHLDPGFPVTIGDYSTEALVIDKDSKDTLWAAWTQSQRVYTAHSLASDTSWSAPTVLPSNTTDLAPDDICSLIHFNGDRIGVVWSDQVANAFRFSFHVDGAAATAWSPAENASTNETDDHINLAADSTGRVFLAGKNIADNLLLLVRARNGGWSRFVISQPAPILTRPCLLLNEQARLIHVFATGQDTGEVFEKTSSLDAISFLPGTGVPRMVDASARFRISDPTSTKQNVDSASGLVVLAHHDSTGFYWHHEIPPTSPPPPVADFDAPVVSGVAPLTVDFMDASSGQITSRLWDFGDGTESTVTDPTHVYDEGVFTVSLTVTGPGGSDTETRPGFVVVTSARPESAFTAAPTTGFAPLTVTFSDESSGDVAARLWSFGDNSFSSAQDPTHTYAAGTYDVSLTVTGPDGSDTETKPRFVVVEYPPPVASFEALPLSGDAPLTVSFTDTSTGPISSRRWSFGDGATSSATNPAHTYGLGPPNATIPFDTIGHGTFTVSLTVTGPGGSDVRTATIEARAPRSAPLASFTVSSAAGIAPLTIEFDDRSAGEITSYLWDFGDGSKSTEVDPSHTYSAGTYTVRLTVSGPGGSDTDTKTDLVVVTAPAVPPTAVFDSSPPIGRAPLTVRFEDHSTGTISLRVWSFGDDTTSTERNPVHTFEPGIYTVRLTVIGPAGSDSVRKTAYVDAIAPLTGDLQLSPPRPGIRGVLNYITLNRATPGSTVAFYLGLVPGSSLASAASCPGGVPVGLGIPYALLGTAQANAVGVATLVYFVPATTQKGVFFFQAVDHATCRASNMVSEEY